VADGDDASTRTVLVAVAANLLIAVAKGVAAVLTGSAALLAETSHSVADTCTEALLYVGVRHSRRPPDERHPLGHGQARYLWSLFAAVGIFVVGGGFAIYDGVRTLRHPEPVVKVPVGVAVLLISAVLEAWSWRTAHRQLREEAAARQLDLAAYMRVSSDPTPSTVFLEDTAALVGIALALASLLLESATGVLAWDGIASLLIGLTLVVVALLLIRRNGTLLIDEAAPPEAHDRLRARLLAQPAVVDVPRLSAVYVGPSQLLVLADVVLAADCDVAGTVDRMRRELLEVPVIAEVAVTPVPAAAAAAGPVAGPAVGPAAGNTSG